MNLSLTWVGMKLQPGLIGLRTKYKEERRKGRKEKRSKTQKEGRRKGRGRREEGRKTEKGKLLEFLKPETLKQFKLVTSVSVITF